MDGSQLSDLMAERWAILRELVDTSNRQISAIDASRMSELMRLLSEKQAPLNRLAEIAEEIRSAAEDDPEARAWDSEECRVLCRQQQEECERMHLELLAIEAECETALTKSRASIQQNLDRVNAGGHAASSYHATPTSGGQLDLSE